MTEAEHIAAFIARKGITHVAEGTNALGLTNRDWQFKVRQPRMSAAERDAAEIDRLSNERHCVVDAAGREHWKNGLGEWIG